MAISIGKRLEELKGVGPGFDQMRIALALSIFTWHCFSISYGQDYAAKLNPVPVPLYLQSLLPMFFGLSGFLVMGSALRTGEVKTFIVLRLLRIVPALFTEVFVSALILGPLLTVLPLNVYFTSHMFWEYLGSLIGRVRFWLPGVFLDNPSPQVVNFALWTVGPEILCYVIMALLMLTGIFRSIRGMLVVTLAYAAVAWAGGLFYAKLTSGDVMPSRLLIFGFLAGNLVYLGRHRLPFSLPLAGLSYVAGLTLIYLAQSRDIGALLYVATPLLVYPVALLGLARIPPLPFFHRGDYSYGIYLFGFPVQQSVTHFLPDHRDWYINLAIALPITLLLAVTSWTFIERPVLGWRKKLLAKPVANPISSAGGFKRRKAVAMACLAAYGLFVIDSSHVLPTRPAIKMVLYGLGDYTYTGREERPKFLQP